MFQRLKFSRAARQDLFDIELRSIGMFGAEQTVRYRRLIGQALEDIDVDPYRPGSKPRPDIGSNFRSYRVELSGKRSGAGVPSSRHVVIYVELSEDSVGVSRILHDSMVPALHIPESHRYGDEAFLSGEEE